MKKILILYFSGAGATLNSIKYMQTCINNITGCSAYIHQMENDLEENINNYDALIIGTPCYHCSPCNALVSFFSKLPKLTSKIPAMIFNSYSLFSCNTNRITAKIIREKNIITIYDTAYRSPASDGTLITPFIKRFFEFEKNIYEKINADCNKFVSIINEEYTGDIPHFKISSIFNAPNKLIGHLMTFNIYIHQDKCVKCDKCINDCPHHALYKNKENYPAFIKARCENCYRCIHHCPKNALSLRRDKTPVKTLREVYQII